ncbi:MAG: hypothetical protein D6694_08620 [Gammaproteobacteria bacterium]|nr:MAG: hypothetical protein D6694_08620 [Gammaproteobacteria bacterium]
MRIAGVHLLEGDRALSWSVYLRLWDLNDGKCLAVLEGHKGWVDGVHLLEGDRALSWSGGDCTLRLWDLSDGKCLAVLEGHADKIRGVHLLEGDRALSFSGDGVRLWDVNEGRCIKVAHSISEEQAMREMLNMDMDGGWQGSASLPPRNLVGAWHGTGPVCWGGNEPKLQGFAENGSWVVINAAKQLKVLEPWRGNRPCQMRHRGHQSEETE